MPVKAMSEVTSQDSWRRDHISWPSLRASLIGILCGAALVWSNAFNLLSFLGLALMGFAFAPLFPLLQLETPRRLGPRHAANAIGFQVAAAGLGMGLLPSFAGVLADRLSLETVGPFLFAGAVAMFVVHEVVAAQRLKPTA